MKGEEGRGERKGEENGIGGLGAIWGGPKKEKCRDAAYKGAAGRR